MRATSHLRINQQTAQLEAVRPLNASFRKDRILQPCSGKHLRIRMLHEVL